MLDEEQLPVLTQPLTQSQTW